MPLTWNLMAKGQVQNWALACRLVKDPQDGAETLSVPEGLPSLLGCSLTQPLPSSPRQRLCL